MVALYDFNPVEEHAIALLLSIATAPSQFEAIKIQCGAQARMRLLEARGQLSNGDVDNLLIVFQAALQKRLHELDTLQSHGKGSSS